jgi:hypothetical protein
MEFFNKLIETIKFQSNHTLLITQETFKALVDAIAPKSSELSIGALELHTEEYLIWTLNHIVTLVFVNKDINVPLANATAEMLNIAAEELIKKDEKEKSMDSVFISQKGTLAALEPSDRIRAIALLEERQIDLTILPFPFSKNQGFVLAITRLLTSLTTFGYYSNWSAYDTTRLETPEKRILEEFPAGWKEVRYPGPSKGYRALRGYLFDQFEE